MKKNRFLVLTDAQTGYPCLLALDRPLPIVAVFPITKFQVEKWIYEGGVNRPEELIERLELRNLPEKEILGEKMSVFPKEVGELGRTYISELNEKNIESIIATNLEVWRKDENINSEKITFPTPGSEWGWFLGWIEGRAPCCGEWDELHNYFRCLVTRDLILQLFKASVRWANPLMNIFRKYLDTVSEKTRGLPFQEVGAYELLSEAQKLTRFTDPEHGRHIRRPVIMGGCRQWPVIEAGTESKWKRLYVSAVPVVGVRPLFYESSCVKTDEIIQVSMDEPKADGNDNSTGDAQPRKIKLGEAVQGRKPLKHCCINCYTPLDKRYFRKKSLHCIPEYKKENGKFVLDEKGEKIRTYDHKSEREEGTDCIGIHSDCFKTQKRHPHNVHVVTVSGDTQTGKSTWLLSLFGMITYPQTISKIYNLFVKDKFKVVIKRCDTQKFQQSEFLKHIEAMWLSGDLPNRTEAIGRALHSPLFLSVKNNRHVFIVNDIAGEATGDDRILSSSKYRPHLPFTTDIIYIHPADEMDSLEGHFEQFIDKLSRVSTDSTPPENAQSKTSPKTATKRQVEVDLKKINLIFCLSKIDKLKFSRKNRELLDILLRPRYDLPDERTKNREDLSQYLHSMEGIHEDLKQWFSQETLLDNDTEKLGSVRYCGFSAFGFEPAHRGKVPDSDAHLPFEPSPIRVADPLFWLMRNYGIINP